MKRRFFAFTVCMAVLLTSFTGCYSAQKDVTSVPSSSQTVQSVSYTHLDVYKRQALPNLTALLLLWRQVVEGSRRPAGKT